MIFSPCALVFLLLFLGIIILLFAFLQIGLITYAFNKVGIAPQNMLFLLVITLLGSFINIPLRKIKGTYVAAGGTVSFFGIRYRVPPVRYQRTTILSVNVGGALIPVTLSIYLLIKFALFLSSFIGIAAVTIVSYKMARPIKGIGIGIPLFIPPLLAAICGLLLSADHAPVVAYISGSLGTLLGADLLHLKQIPNLGAPVASIGGAGTFDGIFLTGIIAVLLAV